jgi:hypothetical protein
VGDERRNLVPEARLGNSAQAGPGEGARKPQALPLALAISDANANAKLITTSYRCVIVVLFLVGNRQLQSQSGLPPLLFIRHSAIANRHSPCRSFLSGDFREANLFALWFERHH